MRCTPRSLMAARKPIVPQRESMGEQVWGFPSRLNWSISWAEEYGSKANLGRAARFILRSDSRWATIGNANLRFHRLKCFEEFPCWLWTTTPRTAEFSSGCSSAGDRKSTRLNSSHANISYAVFCLKKKNTKQR